MSELGGSCALLTCPSPELKTSRAGAGSGRQPLHNLSCCFCNPWLLWLCVQRVTPDKCWSIGEGCGCTCWETWKRNRHPERDCALNLVLTKGKKTQKAHAHSSCLEGWSLLKDMVQTTSLKHVACCAGAASGADAVPTATHTIQISVNFICYLVFPRM